MKYVGIVSCCLIAATSSAMDNLANGAYHNERQALQQARASARQARASNASTLYNPRKWTSVQTLSAQDIFDSLQVINDELTETQAKLDQLSDQIPQDKKEDIDALLAKWCIDAQVYMEHVQQGSKLESAEAFMTTYKSQEFVIAAQVALIEKAIYSAQRPEDILVDLINGLSLDGQVTGNQLIGDFENLSIE